jgi:hypothetical protein
MNVMSDKNKKIRISRIYRIFLIITVSSYMLIYALINDALIVKHLILILILEMIYLLLNLKKVRIDKLLISLLKLTESKYQQRYG